MYISPQAEIALAGPSLAEVAAPCKVFGDVHGQLRELRQLFRAYGSPNHRSGDVNGFRYLFLGDFVDRGPHSLEVLALLAALRVRYPGRVCLVRGNHEDRAVNRHYGFRVECLARFGPRDGEAAWAAANDFFDVLPLGALLGGRILCVHGGLGATLRSLDQIRGLARPCSLELLEEEAEPTDGAASPVLGAGAVAAAEGRAAGGELQQSLLMDILWSDPTESDQVLGLHANVQRGGAARSFGPDRVVEFCAANGLDLLVRAHECVHDGYQWFAGGRCITVFSAANYCGVHDNAGALLEVDEALVVLPKVVLGRPTGPPRVAAVAVAAAAVGAEAKEGWEDGEEDTGARGPKRPRRS
jgi:protein phosphatase/serine/threonine-protein phosphatase BSU1